MSSEEFHCDTKLPKLFYCILKCSQIRWAMFCKKNLQIVRVHGNQNQIILILDSMNKTLGVISAYASESLYGYYEYI